MSFCHNTNKLISLMTDFYKHTFLLLSALTVFWGNFKMA